jgi:hypothetical protein
MNHRPVKVGGKVLYFYALRLAYEAAQGAYNKDSVCFHPTHATKVALLCALFQSDYLLLPSFNLENNISL